MKRLYKANRVNDFDKAMRRKYSLNSLYLIENAARCALNTIGDEIRGKRTLILVGSGNNGADGIFLFLLLRERGEDVHVYYRSEAKSEENSILRKRVPLSAISTRVEGFDVIIDAVYGASFHPPLSSHDKGFFDRINNIQAFKVALDVCSAYYFKADVTISFTMLKEEDVLSSSARLILENPGFPDVEISSFSPDSFLLEDDDYSARSFGPSDYKNVRGHLLIKAGSAEYKGAPILSAKASFHAGCGLVTLNSAKELSDIACYYPPLIYKGGKLDYAPYSALLAGPGWGSDCDRSFFEYEGSMVLDAEALSMIEKGDKFSLKAVLTPHVGEFNRLVRRLGIEDDAVSLSKELEAVIVKKSSIVEIACLDERYFYIGNNPSLGVAGSGDVLAGIIGAFLASGMTSKEAAINAVILHQMSGRRAHERLGYYDSLDLISEVGRMR